MIHSFKNKFCLLTFVFALVYAVYVVVYILRGTKNPLDESERGE